MVGPPHVLCIAIIAAVSGSSGTDVGADGHDRVRPTKVNTCDAITVHGGSERVAKAIFAYAQEVAGMAVHARERQYDGMAFGELMSRVMAAAEQEGTDESGAPNAHVVTVQIGSNDGKSNDPFHNKVVLGEKVSRSMLRHWIPIMFEPSPFMFHKLNLHWTTMARAGATACYITMRRPVLYPSESTCNFYYFNTAHRDGDAKLCSRCTRCEDHPRFMQEQLGSLDRAAMQNYFGPNFERCIAVEGLPCGPIKTVLDTLDWAPQASKRVDVLQVDAEGYDGKIIHGLLDAADESAPWVIYFEAKVMRMRIRSDEEAPYSCEFMDLFDRLDAEGYTIVYNNSEDALAMHSGVEARRPWSPRDPTRCQTMLTSEYPDSWGQKKHAKYPTRQHKIEIWNALQDCCDTKARIAF
mmetsp:Transcript_11531/g.29582  ORF Transcript_11531/g.29582 Transcript_11531/m.29582 type:complete len:409 (+) Transcript_11531:374-1600(+)